MAYSNVLDVPNPDGLTQQVIQARRLEEYTRKAMEEKWRRMDENRSIGEGMYGTWHDDDELLGMNTGTIRGQSKIVVEARRQLHQRKVNEREPLGLGGIEAT